MIEITNIVFKSIYHVATTGVRSTVVAIRSNIILNAKLKGVLIPF